MFKLSTISNRAIAAVTSLTFSVILFATAIVPANQGSLLPGVIA